jgi:hypothetical protein
MMLAMLLAALAGTTAQAATTAPQTPAPSAPAQRAPADAAPRAPASSMSDIGYMTAQQLSVKCNSNAASEISYCFAYIAAVTDAARAYEIWLSAREFCLPAGASQSEVRRAFMTYLSAYPNDASGQAASVVINALKQTYPCG